MNLAIASVLFLADSCMHIHAITTTSHPTPQNINLQYTCFATLIPLAVLICTVHVFAFEGAEDVAVVSLRPLLFEFK